jgi:4'-phosphopantetheinyl transferase
MEVYWLEQTEVDLPARNDWLSSSELIRVEGMRFAKRQADWRLGRWTSKHAVALYLSLPCDPQSLASIEIQGAPSGAPDVFIAGKPATVAISLSHRGGVAACVVGPQELELGCDLEIAEPRGGAFISDYFTEDEQAWIKRTPEAGRQLLLALLWSAKESALKALRTGLRLDTRDVRVLQSSRFQDEDGTWYPLQVSTNGQTFHGWWQNTGELVRTCVAQPPARSPVFLKRTSSLRSSE